MVLPVFSPTQFMPQPAGGAFNPTSLITGAGGFWRADIGVTGTSNVTAWADQSTFAQNLIGANGGINGPVLSSTSFNTSFPGITTNSLGSNPSWFASTTFAFSNSVCSAFILGEVVLATANFARVMSLMTPGAANDFGTANCFTILDTNSAPVLEAANNNISTSPVSTPVNTPILIGVVMDGTNITSWVNGSAQTPVSDTGLIGGAGSNNFGISTLAGSPGNNTWGGTFAFAGITQKVMNSTDWTNLKNWANANWGTSF